MSKLESSSPSLVVVPSTSMENLELAHKQLIRGSDMMFYTES